MSWAQRFAERWYTHAPAGWTRPFEWLYRRIVEKRRADFLAGKTKAWRSPVPVIVVGNITVGGTGKTPLILWLIAHCQARGLRVGVVSRGYGAKPPVWPWRVQAGQSAEMTGDEPLMLVERTRVPLVIDPNRARAAQTLLADAEQTQQPLDLILSDDGLQHYQLARDLELVLIDAARGLGNQHCLPAGPLREPATRLASVDACLLNGAKTDNKQGFAFELKPVALVNLADGQRYSLSQWPAGQSLHAVAGIGNPQRFFTTLEALHWQPIPHPFADHAAYVREDLAFSPDLPVVMTEKDAVKCRTFAAAHWWYLAVEGQPSAAFIAWFDEQLRRLLPR